MMKNKLLVLPIVLIIASMACMSATPPPPITAEQGAEFTLAPDQTATVANTGLTIRLIGVGGDSRCPSGMECAMSGPVSISLSVQQNNASAVNVDLQTFTGSDGRAPGGTFEGIKDRMAVGGYLIRVVAVTPYPTAQSRSIKSSDYRVALTVSKE
jgi:hypothetical protein